MIHTAVLLLAAVSATHGFSEMKADMQAMFDDVQNDEHNFQSSRLAPSHLPLPLAQRVQQLSFYIEELKNRLADQTDISSVEIAERTVLGC